MLSPAGASLRRERGTGVEGGVRARLPPTSLSTLLHSLLEKCIMRKGFGLKNFHDVHKLLVYN